MTTLNLQDNELQTISILAGVERATPDEVIEFVNTASTAMGRETFYNMAEDQQAALLAKHLPVLRASRPLYALMALQQGMADINKQVIVYNLLRTSAALDTIQYHGPTQKLWENAVILQILADMRPNRVLNLGFQLVKGVNTSSEGVSVRPGVQNRRTKKLMKQFLILNRDKLSLWFVKYQRQMRIWARHLHLAKQFHPGVGFLFNDYRGGDHLIDNYLKVQRIPAKSWDALDTASQIALKGLPFTIAEGFAGKFELTREKLLVMFTAENSKSTAPQGMTQRERIRQKSEGERHGIDTGTDLTKLDLWDLLVFLNQEARSQNHAREHATLMLRNAAKREVKKLGIAFDKIAVVLDTSLSMIGTEEGKYHPLLRSMAIKYILDVASEDFTEYRTTESDAVFPLLSGQSNYAGAILRALQDEHKMIFIIGDGYENAPFEGAAHQLIWTFKKRIDKDDEVSFIHLNPVFASETNDVRSISDLAPSAGVLDHKGIGTAIYLAVSKSDPRLALKTLVRQLVDMQEKETKELMSVVGITQKMLLPV